MEEGIDFYFDPNGYMVFTEKYLSDRGYCCGNGCRHCPYENGTRIKTRPAKPFGRRFEEKRGLDNDEAEGTKESTN